MSRRLIPLRLAAYGWHRAPSESGEEREGVSVKPLLLFGAVAAFVIGAEAIGTGKTGWGVACFGVALLELVFAAKVGKRKPN